MQIMTHLVYQDAFEQLEKGNLVLPLSFLDDEVVLDDLIEELTGPLDPVEVVSFSSFLNMIVQTCDPDESARLGRRELAARGEMTLTAEERQIRASSSSSTTTSFETGAEVSRSSRSWSRRITLEIMLF